MPVLLKEFIQPLLKYQTALQLSDLLLKVHLRYKVFNSFDGGIFVNPGCVHSVLFLLILFMQRDMLVQEQRQFF